MVTAPKLLTADEFEALLLSPTYRDRRIELIQGELVETMPDFEHAAIAAQLTIRLGIYLDSHPIGIVLVEARFSVDQHNTLIPDVAMVLGTGNERPYPRGAGAFMPALAVEIKSPSNTLKELREKAAYYLANGSQVVWMILPEQQLVEVYTPTEQVILTVKDTLTGGSLLPDFALPIARIFQG